MKKSFSSPYLKIFISFAAVILFGSVALCLPIATTDRQGLSFIDALFTSTSAVSITGLTVISDYGTTFSTFGKIVIAILMEVGGLSILTLTIFAFILLGRKVGVRDRFLMKEALNQNTSSGIVKLVRTIVISTIVIQLVGTIFSFVSLAKYYPVGQAMAISAFHAIASFNNTGLDIFGYGDSMAHFSSDVFFNITTITLIILGSMGFAVFRDVCSKKRIREYSLITKIIVPSTFVLIIVGMLLYKLALGSDITWLQALFTSVSSRTAGYTVFTPENINNATYVLMIIFMMIGGAPCSTAGGLKITTVFVIMSTVMFYSVGKDPHIFRRRIPKKAIFKAFSLVTLVIGYLAINILILAFLEPEHDIKDIIFEAVAAISNAGISLGITNSLRTSSKLLLVFSMFIGRLGPMTVLNIWNSNWLRETSADIRYVEESIIIG